jgi:hypothetical protein
MAPRAPFVAQPTLNTPLGMLDEMAFRGWTAKNSVPFNAEAPVTDYDMRGFWRAMQQQNPMARSAVDPYDNRMHYPDYWKTPQHQTFSADSQWAGPSAPQWISDATLAAPNGRVLFNAEAPAGGLLGNLAGLLGGR